MDGKALQAKGWGEPAAHTEKALPTSLARSEGAWGGTGSRTLSGMAAIRISSGRPLPISPICFKLASNGCNARSNLDSWAVPIASSWRSWRVEACSLCSPVTPTGSNVVEPSWLKLHETHTCMRGSGMAHAALHMHMLCKLNAAEGCLVTVSWVDPSILGVAACY